jgi:hypothetical protein
VWLLPRDLSKLSLHPAAMGTIPVPIKVIGRVYVKARNPRIQGCLHEPQWYMVVVVAVVVVVVAVCDFS